MPRLYFRRSNVNQKRPPASNVGIEIGEIGINYDNPEPGLFIRTDTDEIVKIGPTHVSTVAPNVSPAVGGTTGNSVGEQWLDTNTNTLSIWDGTQWIAVSGGSVIEDIWMYGY